jgi:hypothetical protein
MFGAIMLALELLWWKHQRSQCLGALAMWLDKLFWGVLRVLTPLGPRYVNPSFAQRIYLLWLFRNFQTLPIKVLSARQKKWIDGLCAIHGFVSLIELNGLPDVPVLGTLEQRPPTEPQAVPRRGPRQAVSAAVVPFAADLQQHS